jgi:hypothetical protein
MNRALLLGDIQNSAHQHVGSGRRRGGGGERGTSREDAPAQADLGEFADFSISEQMAPGAIARVYAELDGELD